MTQRQLPVEAKYEAASRLPMERIVLAPEERRESLLGVIRSARQRLILSVFRCDDFSVLDELAEALRRRVHVEALLTARAKGWKKRLQKLEVLLESMGAEVHRYSDPVVKYHAKYVVADDGPALVTSLNFTRKCFQRTCDFMQITHDPEVVSGLKRLFEADCRKPQSSFPENLSDRLIVGPEKARAQLAALLQQALRSIRIIDAKVTDPDIRVLLKAKKADGVDIEVIDSHSVRGLASHGKLILVDEALAVIGSISLSTLSLEFRREIALVVRDTLSVRQLNEFFQDAAAGRDFWAKVPQVSASEGDEEED